MKFSHFFIERPIFASVISILIVIIGAISFFRLPITQYPNIVPPSIAISTKYAGATPEVIMDTVVAPIEQEVNGVEHMLYISSQCGADGTVTIDVTFEVGTNIDIALVQVQSRVSKAESRLPKEVRDLGVTVRKRSPDMLVFVNLISPKGTRDKLYLTNYAITQIQDRLSRVYGVSEFNVFGAKEYCMRIWMNPERLEALDLSAAQVVNAIQEQNKQIAPGKLNAPPLASGAPFELMINAQGRLQTESEFENIIVKSMPNGRIVRLKDVARIQLDSYLYGNETYINSKSTVSMGAYQLPGSNAVETANALRREMEEIKKEFPADVDYLIGQDTTEYISESISKVYSTIFEAVLLVVFVVMAFLQNWRAAVIPLFAIPVSLIGTFFMMYAFGFSINNLTLFGLVLAIGIVVDDAIVVVENVERNMRLGLKVKEATKQAMTQVQGALIAIVLVLSSVFLPTAFLEGISGQFYRQFAMTIASSTIISGIVSLTLTPALCAAMLAESDTKPDFFTKVWNATFGRFFGLFNR
ncbi:MAG: efflux RND transporter permease subunit, partial [Opitutales bacterium]|nr:efflux RND transporter permease subunit [Opitutales bacterium]